MLIDTKREMLNNRMNALDDESADSLMPRGKISTFFFSRRVVDDITQIIFVKMKSPKMLSTEKTMKRKIYNVRHVFDETLLIINEY